MAIIGFWSCFLNSAHHWAVSRPGSIWLGDTLSHTWRILLCHDVFFLPLAFLSLLVVGWFSLRLVINRTALNPEWIRGRLLVQRDEFSCKWSNRRRVCRRNSSGLPLHEFIYLLFTLQMGLYDFVCKLILCFLHDFSLPFWKIISCTALQLKLFNSSWARWQSCCEMSTFPSGAWWNMATLDRSPQSAVGDQKQHPAVLCSFNPPKWSREGLCSCWLWRCFGCSTLGSYGFGYDKTTPQSWILNRTHLQHAVR